jgi:hypothetical protein
MTAKTKQPDSTLWSVQDATKFLGKDRETIIKRMSQAGLEMGTGRGAGMRWPSSQIIEAYYGSLEMERILKTRTEREIAEIDLATKRNELLNAAELRTELERWMSTMRLTAEAIKDPADRGSMMKVLQSPLK